MRTEQEVRAAIDKHADTIKRIGLTYLKNDADMEDVFQRVFLKYVLFEKNFESDQHEKAWFIRVSINECKDYLKSFHRSRTLSLDGNPQLWDRLSSELMPEQTDVLRAVTVLPENYRNAIYLHYYEGYTASEVGRILGKKENTIYTWLARGRTRLEKVLGGDG